MPSDRTIEEKVDIATSATLVPDMQVNYIIPSTTDTITQSVEAQILNDAIFYEIVRRIPKAKLILIEAKLKEVTFAHITSLLLAISDQKNLLENDSFIHDEIFPFAALQAVKIGQISSIQFGTLMALWGSLETILPKPAEQDTQGMPEYVPLFTNDGEDNPRASALLILSLQPSLTLPNLVTKTAEELLKGIYDKAVHLPQSEQGFWIIEAPLHKSVMGKTVTQAIKSLDMKFLAFDAFEQREMVPSFGLQQAFLEVAFPHAVRINPVIGTSTPIDIRKGSLERYRDIALPFPGNELPKSADDLLAPSALDFIFHDRYHAIRASRVTPEETAHYVAIADNLNMMQKRYDCAVKEFSKRHEEHTRLLPEFAKAIEKLPAEKQHEITEQVLRKFNQEIAIINKLKKMRKSNGQLKFRIWDMERGLSGNTIDGPIETALKELIRIIGSIEIDLALLGKLQNTVELSNYSARRTAHAVLEVVKPDAATLAEVQNHIKQSRSLVRRSFLFFTPTMPTGQQAFINTILEAPAPLPQQLTSS